MISREIKNINIEKFLSKILIDKETECWNFIGAFDGRGYGRCYFWENKKSVSYLAHRVSGTIFNIITDLNKVLDHKCRNTKCCNPDHLREVEFKVNVLENSYGKSAINQYKTHCPNNHIYDKINKAGSRYCSICKREQSKRAKLKRKLNKG